MPLAVEQGVAFGRPTPNMTSNGLLRKQVFTIVVDHRPSGALTLLLLVQSSLLTTKPANSTPTTFLAVQLMNPESLGLHELRGSFLPYASFACSETAWIASNFDHSSIHLASYPSALKFHFLQLPRAYAITMKGY